MDDVVGGWWEACPAGISLYHLHVGQAALCGEFAGQGHIGRFEVQPNDPPCRAYPVGQQIKDPAWPAAQIDRLPSRGDANPVQQHSAVAA